MGITSWRLSNQFFRIAISLSMARLLRDNQPCSACVLILAEDGSIATPRDGVKERTRVAGPSGVSLLSDKKVTKVSDESFGLALGKGGSPAT